MRKSALVIVVILACAGTARAQSSKISPRGMGGFGSGANRAILEEPTNRTEGPEQDRSFQKFVSGSVSQARVPASGVPHPDGLPVTVANPAFLGITHLDQGIADPGHQFSLEPPDQGFGIGGTNQCSNGPCILEAVNSAIAVYDSSGTLLALASLHQFFGLPPAFTAPSTFGPFVSDPRIYFDWPTNRWFGTAVLIERNPTTGALGTHSSLLVAVSASVSPFAGFVVYEINGTNNGTGGTPSHTGCPCFGDQPLIGADTHAFWVSTNEFPIHGAGFNGAQIYALDKAALETGGPANVQFVFQGGPLAEGTSYTVQPAIVPPGGAFASINNGTQYFLSALDFFGTLDNRLAIWAATNTASIHTTPAISIQNEIVGNTTVYGQPPSAQQPNIPVADICAPSLFMLVGCGLRTGTLAGFEGLVANVHAPLVDSNDDRMQQVTFAAGKLWTTVTTVAKTKNGPTRSAAAWFALTPAFNGSDLTGTSSGGGYVAVNDQSVLFPAIAVNKDGKGAIGFSLVGPGLFPGTAFAKVSLATGATQVNVTSLGVFPDDGFTGYPVFDDRDGRWGDYGAAVADADGNIWVANEMIPCEEFRGPGNGCFRTTFANWGTLIAKIIP